jgi:hypothetical protein
MNKSIEIQGHIFDLSWELNDHISSVNCSKCGASGFISSSFSTKG